MSEKVILDTDIGSDIDDAVCLAFLLAQPECDLIGITTVTGQAGARAQMCSALCHVAGRDDIPIFPGLEKPLLVEQRQPHAPQAGVLDRWPHRSDFPTREAIPFLISTIRANPGEITLLAIGPMTNIGLLFALDPEVPSLLKRLVLMNGHFQMSSGCWGPVEWNSGGDPHATAIVYNGKAPIHRSIGIDVTSRVSMSAADVKARFTSKLLCPVLDFAGVWFEHVDRITFHDPLAAATIFDDRICTFAHGDVNVELISQPLAGFTHWRGSEHGGPHEVAVDVDTDRFFEHYFSVFE
jgi:inosine-uridine nucleoside N-ribohydrolase